MKKLFYFAASVILILVSCKGNTIGNTIRIDKSEIIDDYFLTEELQSKLTPDTVIHILKERNKEYTEDNLTIRNTSKRIRKAAAGQYPAAVVLSCLDSRVPVEDVFHCGIGDLFVARVAGNICNDDILGSLEYACKVSGAKVVIVLGHEQCGAIKSAIDNVQLGNITQLLSKVKPAIGMVSDFSGEKTSKNSNYVDAVTKANIINTIKEVRSRSQILKEMEADGSIKIIGGQYHIETGIVEILPI